VTCTDALTNLLVTTSVNQVVSFNGEKEAIAVYDKLIHKAYKATVEGAIINGFGTGSVFCIFFSSYGVAIWYGGKLILSKGYTGGDVINILFAIMIGAM
jgi:ATP-binding cassette subfamily B (MDR/TAP) protein 1